MKTSNKLLILAAGLIILSLLVYDFLLRDAYLKQKFIEVKIKTINPAKGK